MIALFDLDGVLIDSADVVRQAYNDAGVDCPSNILELEGSTWLEDQVGEKRAVEVKAIKRKMYLHYIKTAQAPLLPAIHVAKRLMHEGWLVLAATGAPEGTRNALHRAFRGQWFPPLLENTRTPAKMNLIKAFNESGVYIDDQSKFIDLPTRWKFVQYTGQTYDDLYIEVTACGCA